ncbi:UDP-glucosyltransferase 2-like isoform X1 [Anticarsia gemmatalis]|uniref:UDP-glucosyltransferase 2-like isoform X1 n=2 Tax=Anticarsia gemmatalis TaxID=129554 RepID=UPI003F75A147
MYNMKSLYLIVLLCACDAYKILVITQMPSKSHSILNDGVVRQLLKDGHEVTYLRSIEYKNAPPTLRQIDVSDSGKVMPAAVINIEALMKNEVQWTTHEFVKRMKAAVAIKTVENKDVQKLLNDPNEHFDVAIIEIIYNDLLASIAAVFDCPLIWLSPVEVNSDVLSLIDEIPNPGQVSDILSMNTGKLSFLQRAEELWSLIKSQFTNYWYIDDIHIDAYNRLIAPIIAKRGRQPPSFNEIRYNASLVLGYSHVSTGEAVRLPQNYKPIGGYHIDEEIQPLPEELKIIMDNAKHGVIYFSMGSNLKSKEWPEEIKRNLVKMLGTFKQTVLWKFEEQLPNTPKNVYISNWLPQQSVLAHPNCILFISHGGLLSVTETVHFGVPMIGIPGFYDQFVNTKRAVNKGFAVKVDMTYNVVEDLKVAVEEMISNPVYRQKAKEYSFIYHDRPVKPNEEISHWVRHVIETKGAPHLRSPALSVPFYQRLFLDLAAILLIIIVIAIKLLRFAFSSIFQKKISDSKKKNR